MRHVPITLAALLLFTTVVSAQTVTVAGNSDIIVARLMAFDRNNDGLVAKDELPERMHFLVPDDGDGALDYHEILALVAVPRSVAALGGGFPRPGGYTFGDQFELSSRSHVLESLDDLRLPASTRADALRVVDPFIESFEAQATTALLKDLEGLLGEDQLAKVRAAADRQLTTRPTTRSLPDGTTVRQLVASTDVAAVLNEFHLPAWQRALALESVRHFKDRLRSGEALRTALLEHLTGILSEQEREDFRAALARRPLVKSGRLLQR